MKEQRIALALLVALLCFATAAHAAVLTGPSLNASLLYYQPLPASPGSQLDVYVQIQNSGETARNVIVRFVDNSPFTISSESDRVKSLPSIPGNENALIKYKVRVSQDAVPGTNFIKLQYELGSSGQEQTVLLPVDVFSNTVALNVENMKSDPESLVPGSVGKFTFDLRNSAPIKIREGTVTLDIANLDLIPVGGTNQQRFTDLQSGEVQQFAFNIAPSPNMAPGIYKIPVNISFNDQNGRNYQRTEYIGMRVGSKPDISVTIDETRITADQTSGDVIIRVTNKGLGEIKFVDLSLGQSDSFELTSGSQERYIGNIDSDDYKTARVQMQAKGDRVEIPVIVTYMDALNTKYTETETLSFPVRKANGGGSNSYLIIGVVAVVLIGGYLFFRRRKSK